MRSIPQCYSTTRQALLHDLADAVVAHAAAPAEPDGAPTDFRGEAPDAVPVLLTSCVILRARCGPDDMALWAQRRRPVPDLWPRSEPFVRYRCRNTRGNLQAQSLAVDEHIEHVLRRCDGRSSSGEIARTWEPAGAESPGMRPTAKLEMTCRTLQRLRTLGLVGCPGALRAFGSAKPTVVTLPGGDAEWKAFTAGPYLGAAPERRAAPGGARQEPGEARPRGCQYASPQEITDDVQEREPMPL